MVFLCVINHFHDTQSRHEASRQDAENFFNKRTHDFIVGYYDSSC
jgi:hypothetical protein